VRSRGDALIEGAANGRSNIVQSMLERGADISHKDRNGDTALHRAIQNGHKDIALFLLHRGADKMAKGFGGAIPFILAARCGFLELVKLLLNDASDLLATDSNGFTALHVASQNKRRDVVSFILGLNAEDQLEVSTDRDKISTGVPVISRWAQVVHVVLEMRVGPYGFTALHSAASTGDYKTVQLLLKGGADVSSRAGDNSTPLTVSATDGHYRIVELLLDQGADISERGHHEYTALHLAAEVGHTNVVALLLERGADITAKEDRGYTPLQRAAASGFDTIVEKLISRVDMGNSTKAVTPARVHSSPPATEWAKKEDPSIPTAGRNTYTMIEVVKRSIMKRSEIQQSHQSITITRQTDQHASRIELRGSLGGKINGSKTAAGVAGKPVNERKLLERVENSTTHEELLSGTKQISGEPETHLQKIQMSKANAKSKRQQGTRKRVGKILKRSCVVS
jgi:ankyrin repeat protein